MSWEVITKPKKFGGLGFQKLEVVNTTCIMKLGLDIRHDSNTLWCEVLRGKYGRGVKDRTTLIVKPTDSSLWKNIVKSWPLFEEFEFRAIGSGLDRKAWDGKSKGLGSLYLVA